MGTRRRRGFVPSSWATASFGAALLASACLAPEFTKLDQQAETGGFGGVGGTTTGSTPTGSGGSSGAPDASGSGAGSSDAGGVGGDRPTSTSGASGGSEAGGSGGSDATNGGAGGSSTGGSTTTSSSTGGSTTTSTSTGGTGGSCAEGLEECSGECVDTSSSLEHCGACGSACALLEQCNDGECECAEGYTECASGCVQLSSNGQHCGTCDKACEPGEVCSDGGCSADCGPGLTECESGCAFTGTSLEHCGGCNNACDPGFECSGGSCGCSAGLTECDGTCVDTQSSEQHCNGCNMPCAADESCNNGSCACSGGLTECDGACVDTDTNTAHCGACDTPCDTRCEVGTCVDIPGYWTEGSFRGCSSVSRDYLGTTVTPLDFTGPGDELYCVEGSLYADYEAYVLVGFNLAEAPTMEECGLPNPDVVPPAVDIEGLGTGIAVRFDLQTNTTFRIVLQGPNGATDPNDRWCATMPAPDASGRAFVPFSAFNTECWGGGSGNPYAGGEIVSVAFLVPGASHSEPYSFCVYGWAVGNSIADAP